MESVDGMTKAQIRIIRRLYIWPVTAVAFFAAGLFAGLMGVLLSMVGSVFFHISGGDERSFMACITVMLAGMVLFLFQTIAVIFGARGKKWRQILEKAHADEVRGDYSTQLSLSLGLSSAGKLMSHSDNEKTKTAGDVATAIGGVIGLAAIVGMLMDTRKNARAVAEIEGIRLPSVKWQVVGIVLIPVVLLTAISIPPFVQSLERTRAEAETAWATIQKLERVFEAHCDSAYGNDPRENYQEYGYGVSGTRYHENDLESYIRVTVNNQGLVERVTYCCDVDIGITPGENLARAAEDMAFFHDLLVSGGVEFAGENLTLLPQFTEAFTSSFCNNSYYEDCRDEIENQGITFWYDTTPEEKFNEYTDPYFYITIDPVA